MSRYWDYQRLLCLLALAFCGLSLFADWSSSARADEFELQFSLTEDLEFAVFQNENLYSASLLSEQPLATDSTVLQAAYADRRAGGSRGGGSIRIGYDEGFVIASPRQLDLGVSEVPYLLRLNGWGQLRHTSLNSQGTNPDVNQFQLKRARLIFSGHAYTSDFAYYVQLDGRSSSGNDVRLLDYFLTYDIGRHVWDLNKGTLVFKTGQYKMPFTMARSLSGREFEFSDRSMASTFFDVNRSLAWGLGGARDNWGVPWDWEIAVFNGLVTGGAETGSSGSLDNNFAYSGRISAYPIGEWGSGQLADFDHHNDLAMRSGMAFANSTIDSYGTTEFASARVVDAGVTLASLLPMTVDQYTVNLYSIDTSLKWRGWSTTFEYYFRHIDQFDNPAVDQLFDHGFWFQLGKFVISEKLQLLARWSRVVGDSGTLGVVNQSSEEIAGGLAWYFREQSAKLTLDGTYLDGAPVSSSALGITPGDYGWLFRAQIQFAF